MDYVKSVTQEKMQVWMNIMIKYFTLPISTASSPDAEKNWNCYAPIQDIFHKNSIYLKKLGSRNLSILAPKHHYRSVWPLNMHDSMLFQPEDDSGWSCGPFTIVKVLETLLQLERNGKFNQISWQTGTFPFGD